MTTRLRDLRVLVLDCQAAGATPAYGDLLELGWAVCDEAGRCEPARAHWIARRTERSVPRAIRELTGWSEATSSDAITEAVAWQLLSSDSAALTVGGTASAVPTLIHYASFELPFLRDLHARLGGGEPFPFDVRCVHAIAARLFPDLPRRNIRALAGFLGHSAELSRRSAGHVQATAFIWRALVPKLEEAGIDSWSTLTAWLETTPRPSRPARRSYPLPVADRRALPDCPGVYRFVRSNADVLYVGKAASIKKRVASHFSSAGRPTERALEMLTQVQRVDVTQTESILEAALLETDEIKRLEPPYNVQLRGAERSVWFASRDLGDQTPVPDATHRVGPLPSRRALAPYAALIALTAGETATERMRAAALAVPWPIGPDAALFAEGWAAFAEQHLHADARSPARRVERASRALWLLRGREEPTVANEDAARDDWDLARVVRRLERSLVGGGLIMRRARWLCLLAGAQVAFRERAPTRARWLVLSRAQIIERGVLPRVADLVDVAPHTWRQRDARQACFDAAAYDRLRVLTTELLRVSDEGGELAVRLGSRMLIGDKLARITRLL